MPIRNNDKNKNVLKELEKTISPVLVLNNSALKPYVELFEYEPENIYQQPLGSLVGFFEVKEFSDESAYIVNHLTAVLKKEYYINPKRPVTESLDSALHKVNMALSEIARIGNVEWLGKINAAICVLEKNNAHFSVSGNAKIFLHRKMILSEISEDLASDALEPHPLKTFINVSSGRLEKNDRLILTSEDIFHILPINEIEKNLQRLEGEKFVQFLKTALSNQMEMLPSIVVEMTEVAPVITRKTSTQKKPSTAKNFFSEQTFANSLAAAAAILSENEQFNENTEKKDGSNYTDKKTGHIYIQGEALDSEKSANSQLHLYQDLAKEKITQAIFLTKNEIRKRFSLYKKQLAKKRALRQAEKEKQDELDAEEAKRLAEQRVLQELEAVQKLAEQQEIEKALAIEQKLAHEQELAAQALIQEQEIISQQESSPQPQLQVLPKKSTAIKSQQEAKETSTNNFELSFKEKLRQAKLEQQGSAVIDLKKIHETPDVEEVVVEEFNEEEFETELENEIDENQSKIQGLKSQALNYSNKAFAIIQSTGKSVLENTQKMLARKGEKTSSENSLSIIPHFSKIKKLFSRFTFKQKLYTFSALAIIFIAPLFIVQFLNKPKTPTITQLQVVPKAQSETLANEKNMRLVSETKSVYSNGSIVTSLFANNIPTIITKSSIVLSPGGQNKEFQLPTETGSPIKATYMNDLSLIFIITDTDKIISFSPISEKFTQSNNIDLANISQESPIGTYLTYLYVLDQKANQIYRFPRAEGGFGERSSWLKDSISLSNSSDMTIDDNIYSISNNKVLKFFKGKAVPFELESSTTPVAFSKLYTTPDLQSLYILDTQNARIVQYSKDGSIIAQFYNDKLEDGFSLSVDEKNKVAYVATSSELISMSLQ